MERNHSYLLFDEIKFFKETGLNKDLAHVFENHNGTSLKDIQIITPAVLAHVEAWFKGFIEDWHNPFFPKKKAA